jgi:hypothetical protein
MERIDRERLKDWLVANVPEIKKYNTNYRRKIMPRELINGHLTLEAMLIDAMNLGDEDE